MGDVLLGRGWAFPLQIRDGRVALTGGDAKIREALWVILTTSPGERLMRPEFGCGLRDLVFAANTASLRGQVSQRVRDAVVRFEPRVDLLDVAVESAAGAPNILLIRLDYRVRATNAFYNLVYPFYLEEGPDTPSRPLLDAVGAEG